MKRINFFLMYQTPRQIWYAIYEIILNKLYKTFPKIEYFRDEAQWCWVQKWVKL